MHWWNMKLIVKIKNKNANCKLIGQTDLLAPVELQTGVMPDRKVRLSLFRYLKPAIRVMQGTDPKSFHFQQYKSILEWGKPSRFVTCATQQTVSQFTMFVAD